MTPPSPAGALVISLDFELLWGWRDRAAPPGGYAPLLLGARRAIPALLDLFEEFEVAGTWATVGCLFAGSRAELERFAPARRPAYADRALSPYAEPVGASEAEDPLHLAPSLIAEIRRRPRQEIATHTFSHCYCLEPGMDREAFRADLASAVAIARHHGVALQSIVFPRNQHNPAFDDLLADAGIRCYRGNQRAWMYRAGSGRHANTRAMRAARLLDTYVGAAGSRAIAWSEVPRPHGLCDVPASFFLRSHDPRLAAFDGLRLRRLARSLRHAAVAGEIVHLWCHPSNLGVHTPQALAFLRAVLAEFARCRDEHGMRSLTMAETARLARGGHRFGDPGVPTAGVPEPPPADSAFRSGGNRPCHTR